jgi:hypothetical protein
MRVVIVACGRRDLRTRLGGHAACVMRTRSNESGFQTPPQVRRFYALRTAFRGAFSR